MKKASLKVLIYLIITIGWLSSTGCTKSREITGTWYWKSKNDYTELNLVQNKKQVSGGHCSNFKNGSKLDCTSSDSENSISLHLVSENVYEGTIQSGFSEAVVNVRLTLNPNEETLHFKQLSQPSEEYYLPNNVYMTLAQP